MIWNRDPWANPVARGESGVSVFAIDPGGTTGWVWGMFTMRWINGSVPGALAAGAQQGWIKHGQERTYPEWMDASPTVSQDRAVVGSLYKQEHILANNMMRRIRQANEFTANKSGGSLVGITHLAVEDFIVRERTQNRNLLSPVRLNTAIYNYVADEDELSLDYHLQSASDKSIVTDDQLRSYGLYFPGEPHACDASRHLVLFLQKLRAG